jgi:hypothetical protein
VLCGGDFLLFTDSYRVTATEKILWAAYCILTLTPIFLYHAGGMDWFDVVYGVAGFVFLYILVIAIWYTLW